MQLSLGRLQRSPSGYNRHGKVSQQLQGYNRHGKVSQQIVYANNIMEQLNTGLHFPENTLALPLKQVIIH